MVKSIEYKGYTLTSNAVLKNGKKLPQDRWCLSDEYGVILCDEDDADFDPNFEGNYDLSGIELTPAEEAEYQKRLPLQRRVEESFKNGEWEFKITSSWEQDLGSPTRTTWERWEHPEFGIVTKSYPSEQWSVPSKYSADRYKYMELLGKKSAALRVLRFQAWVDYWENIDHPKKPRVDKYQDVKASVVERLKSLGVPEQLIEIDKEIICVKGAKAWFYDGKEVYSSLGVWYANWDDVKITPEQVQACYRYLYSEYKEQRGNKPCKSFEKWLATRK